MRYTSRCGRQEVPVRIKTPSKYASKYADRFPVGPKTEAKKRLRRDARRKTKVAIQVQKPDDDYDPWLD
jgi:hypothetical protein